MPADMFLRRTAYNKMNGKVIWPLLAFILVFSMHAAYVSYTLTHQETKWITVEETNWVTTYLQEQEYFIGLSYALAAAFTVYALLTYAENRKKGLVGLFSGITLTGLIYFGACFLAGCCGSPMVAVYVSLLGPSFLGVAKSVTLFLTIISVSVGYYLLKKKGSSACGDKCLCKPDQ